MKERCFLAVFLVLVLTTSQSHAQRAPEPKCIGAYLGIYVEGTIQIPKGSETDSCTNDCINLKSSSKSWQALDSNGWPTRPVEGELIVPTQGAGVTPRRAITFCVHTKDKTGTEDWRSVPIFYDQITSLSFGFVPREPFFSGSAATIVSASVSGATTVLGVSNVLNTTWKTGLGVTGLGVAAYLGFRALDGATGFPLKRYKRKEWYYLLIRFNDDPSQARGQRADAKAKSDYTPEGGLAVFAMEMESFWPTTLLLQSGTGLPLRALPVPGQSAK